MFSNAQRIRRLGLGIVLDMHSLTEASLTEALENILKPESRFPKNSAKIKELLEFERNQKIAVDVPHTLQKFLRFSTPDFQRFYIPKGSHLSYLEYFHLDLFCFLLITILTFSY